VDTHDSSSALDGWLIRRLREEPRTSRLGELLLDGRSAAARIAELEALVLELEAQLSPAVPPGAAGHLLFRSTAQGYELRELDGPAPHEGDPVLLDGGRYRVERIGRSPLPGDRRPCLYLEAE
jgi:hypothetical protein